MNEGTRQTQPPFKDIVFGLVRACAGLIPLAILASSLVAGVLVFLIQTRAAAQFKALVREENRLRLRSAVEHVEDYFDAVYSTLLFVSVDEDVQAMRSGSEEFIHRSFDHEWQRHRLSELYVIERDFPGTRRPFQTYEHEAPGSTLQETHSQAREAEEYQVQMSQIRRFLADTNLPGLISSEINLCVEDETNTRQRARGLVYALPVFGSNGLAGIVAGMIPTTAIESVLRKGRAQQATLLVNDRGEMYGGQTATPRLLAAFKEQLVPEGVAPFFARAPQSFPVDSWVALWAPVRVFSAEKWWLVSLTDEDRYVRQSSLMGTLGKTALPGALVLAGVAMAMAAGSWTRRLEEQVRHLRQREQLEHQVQAVSEREQRRIGENLHEDLCQRLAGLEAAGKALQKRLKTRPQVAVEMGLAAEISGELHETLGRAQQLADELQPVSLLSEGFLAAVEHLAERARRRFGIRCRVESRDFPHLEDAALATQLYRIVQEALNNALQHAQATEIVIILSVAAGQIEVAVRDNGRGLPPEPARGTGMGLSIMRYRCDLIDGVLHLKPTNGGGTTVACSCPWKQAGPEEANPKRE